MWFYQPRILILALSKIFPKVLFYVPTSKPIFALTFDDGPGKHTEQILQILKKYDAKATFFVVGKRAEAHPEIIKKIKSGGHEMANHFYDIQSTVFLSKKRIEKSLIQTENLIGQTIPHMFVRPSGSLFRPSFIKLTDKHGFRIVLGSAYALDWANPPRWYLRWALRRMLRPGAIVILHDGHKNSQRAVDVLPDLLDYAAKQGLKSLNLRELLAAA